MRSIALLSSAVVVHHGGASAKRNPRVAIERMYLSKLALFRKHRGRLALWALAGMMALQVGAKAALRCGLWLALRRVEDREKLSAYRTVLRAARGALPWREALVVVALGLYVAVVAWVVR